MGHGWENTERMENLTKHFPSSSLSVFKPVALGKRKSFPISSGTYLSLPWENEPQLELRMVVRGG